MNQLIITKSINLLAEAKSLIPGGVNSPVRSFSSVGGDPRFIKSASGCYLYDEDDNCYIDYVGSWGPVIVGHAHPQVVEAINKSVMKGISFGAPTALENQFVAEINKLMPCIEKLRLVNSGTEATMSAIRLIRGFTGRNKLVKFIGCYHGHSDGLLVEAGSGNLTFGKPSSAGVPEDITKNTITIHFNDLHGIKKVFAAEGKNIAGVIVEPIAGNMGMVMPNADFLPLLRKLCDQNQSLLIFDEVMSGFRVGLGGATEFFNIKPDLITLGKVIGGGMPVAAFGGRAEIMNKLSPTGGVYQAGTLSGNPIALSAGLATLKIIQSKNFYSQLAQLTQQLVNGLIEIAKYYKIDFSAQYLGGMFGIYFSKTLPQNLIDQQQCNTDLFKIFFHKMLNNGIYLAPSPFEAGFVSSAHNQEVINQTLKVADSVFKELK